jgi:hypothetical protein
MELDIANVQQRAEDDKKLAKIKQQANETIN